jgi:hypothetical protein
MLTQREAHGAEQVVQGFQGHGVSLVWNGAVIAEDLEVNHTRAVLQLLCLCVGNHSFPFRLVTSRRTKAYPLKPSQAGEVPLNTKGALLP